MTHEPLLRLRAIRVNRALSVAELAAAAGVSDDTIRRIESGERAPQMRTARALAAALDVRVADLLGDAA